MPKKIKTKKHIQNKTQKTVTKAEIQHYAMELFLTPSDMDIETHGYTYREIVEKIKQKFKISVTAATVFNWGNKLGWGKMWESGQKAGIEKIKQAKKAAETYQETYQNEMGKKRVDRYKTNVALFAKAAWIINNELDNAVEMIKKGKKIDRETLRLLMNNIAKLNAAVETDEKDTTDEIDNQLNVNIKIIQE